MGVFSRSWDLTKITLGVIKKDKELIIYPILSSVLSLIFVGIMIIPLILATIRSEIIQSGGLDTLNILVIFLLYLGLAFIFTFFSFCIVYTAKKRFEGGNATFFESIKYSFSRIHLIFLWSIVAATVGLILHMIENAGRKGRSGKNIIAVIISRMIGAAWNIITLFVMPAMVYGDIGPFKAIGKSFETLKKTWGESLVRYFGFGVVEVIFGIIGIIGGVILIIFSVFLGPVAIILAILLVAGYFVLITSFFVVANAVYNTALYSYAQTNKIPEGFSKEHMKNAFQKQDSNE